MNNSKIVLSTKTTSAIFLAIVLVTGTIIAISPSSFIIGVSAQGETYYNGGMDNGYDSYEPTDYGMDDYNTPYGNDNYYKSKYSDFIKKIKCKNNNININGENTGDINLGNDGQKAAAGEGYLSAGSFGDGYGNEGYNKKGFDCVTNNNENIVQGGTGPQGPSGITRLDATNIYSVINSSSPAPGNTFTFAPALCDPGDLVLNGGYNLLGSNIEDNESVTTGIDQPIVEPLGAGWFTFVSINEEPSSSELRLNVFALCFDNPPLRP